MSEDRFMWLVENDQGTWASFISIMVSVRSAPETFCALRADGIISGDMKPIPDDPDFIVRFNARIDRSRGELGCWPVNLAAGDDGYASFSWAGPNGERWKYRAHRLALTLADPPASDSLYALHECNNPMCCNPTPGTGHLYWGTALDNAADRDHPYRRWQLRNRKIREAGQLGLFAATREMFPTPANGDEYLDRDDDRRGIPND
jgi:hypothetical protein